MANQVLTLYAAGGFNSSNSNTLGITFLTVEIGVGGVTISHTGGNLAFGGTAKLTGVGQATAPADVVVLDANSKVPAAFIPSVSITDVTVVADITARNALTIGTGEGQYGEGDVAVVTDDTGGTTNTATTQSYIRLDSTTAQPGGWSLIQTGGVVSINGFTTAVVVLDADDLLYTQGNPAHWTLADNSNLELTLDEVGSRLFALEALTASGDLRYFVATGLIGEKNVVILLSDGTVQQATLASADATKQIAIYAGAATLATGVSGAFFLRNGSQITGYTAGAGLNTGAIQYVAAAGALTGVAPAFAAGTNVYRVGVALSTTTLLFDPRHVVEHA